MADSYPVRRAAQLTAYMFHRGKELGEEGIEKLRESDTVQQAKQDVRQTSQRASRFGSTLMKELEEGFKDMNEKMKKRG
ncbi:hypothetical protein BaRGS_00013131 [Batillaria attramentaria]|uniref:Uncharacterized protein n=1 Tax=Batillaria attramentaria TaxID=370345 RepID=A0ABD0L985_9CAEN